MEDYTQGFSATGHRPSLPVLGGIVLLHVVLFYALIQAFAPDMVSRALGEQMSTFDVETVPEPAAPPDPPGQAEDEAGDEGDPGERAQARAVSAPQSPIPMPDREAAPRTASTGNENQSGAAEAGDGTGASGSGDGTGAGEDGQGSGGGGVAVQPRLTRSISDVSLFEIPAGGRAARVGTSTIVILDVSAQGRVTSCRVSRSSGFPNTDAKVCELSYDRIRFEPARDAAGNPVPATFYYQQRYFERS
ncbi:TonB family protein [Alteriqipengyuania sp.]|uniref:TonB family protein n=1 Tax=Alteriqipengyuania sp. TaxID=2800692 RepID=UPI003519BFBB